MPEAFVSWTFGRTPAWFRRVWPPDRAGWRRRGGDVRRVVIRYIIHWAYSPCPDRCYECPVHVSFMSPLEGDMDATGNHDLGDDLFHARFKCGTAQKPSA